MSRTVRCFFTVIECLIGDPLVLQENGKMDLPVAHSSFLFDCIALARPLQKQIMIEHNSEMVSNAGKSVMLLETFTRYFTDILIRQKYPNRECLLVKLDG